MCTHHYHHHTASSKQLGMFKRLLKMWRQQRHESQPYRSIIASSLWCSARVSFSFSVPSSTSVIRITLLLTLNHISLFLSRGIPRSFQIFKRRDWSGHFCSRNAGDRKHRGHGNNEHPVASRPSPLGLTCRRWVWLFADIWRKPFHFSYQETVGE